ncbi:glutaredoxin family protein [Atopobium fossor]|uniref:glutaredoxin family protein n=1 Tax=Atopobium fossor TaxID=39487 RepID=UPI0004003D21|nr:glutaredoxin domain-containing protein [Atopobium fossor]
MATSDLQLYIKNGCPFCHKVTSFMKANNIELPLHNISVSDADRDFLIEHGGKRQVPCLFIDGKALYESNDIIAYLGKVFSVSAVAEVAEKSTQAADSMSDGASCTIGGGCSF